MTMNNAKLRNKLNQLPQITKNLRNKQEQQAMMVQK